MGIPKLSLFLFQRNKNYNRSCFPRRSDPNPNEPTETPPPPYDEHLPPLRLRRFSQPIAQAGPVCFLQKIFIMNLYGFFLV
jgi:hypothetical protein